MAPALPACLSADLCWCFFPPLILGTPPLPQYGASCPSPATPKGALLAGLPYGCWVSGNFTLPFCSVCLGDFSREPAAGNLMTLGNHTHCVPEDGCGNCRPLCSLTTVQGNVSLPSLLSSACVEDGSSYPARPTLSLSCPSCASTRSRLWAAPCALVEKRSSAFY